uniref:USP domain-containing protein n=1 Tax=Zonotrichia albicollis TaxID=44394 RepID=A0A8D2MZM7_ZONAL
MSAGFYIFPMFELVSLVLQKATQHLNMILRNNLKIVSPLFKHHFPADIAEEMALPQRIFPPEKISMDWQQRQRPGAGLFNLGNTCYINVILQCLTYTPPLANYLLSYQHSQSCQQQGFCMMCTMESHVRKVLCSSATAILPGAVLRDLKFIGEEFEYGRQENAYEFLRCTLDAMHRACLSCHLDVSSEETTIVHQIFGGFMKSREDQLGLCLVSRCKKKAAASKKVTVHRAPRVLTLCLERADQWTGTKISKFVEYPEYLDLRPYMSDTAGEPLLCSLYAIVVHSGDTCLEGHFLCYAKASNGLWYKMDDESVDNCDIHTVLGQQAYLLFYKTFPYPKLAPCLLILLRVSATGDNSFLHPSMLSFLCYPIPVLLSLLDSLCKVPLVCSLKMVL